MTEEETRKIQDLAVCNGKVTSVPFARARGMLCGTVHCAILQCLKLGLRI